MEQRNYKVYMHVNKVNGKRYIGITRQDIKIRWSNGNGYRGQKYFWRAIKKHGWNNFTHEILFCNLLGREAEELEKSLIASFKSNIRKFGYNILKGGGYTGSKSSEVKEKIKLNHADVSGKKNPMYGVHPWCFDKGQPVVCLDTGVIYKNIREVVNVLKLKEGNIRAVIRGRQLSTGGLHFKYLKDYNEKEWFSPNIGNNKSVVCTDTGEIFSSIKECACTLNLDESSIAKVCKGKYKSTKGYHFQYWGGQKIVKSDRGNFTHFRRVHCLNNNVTYDSIKEAAKSLEVDSSAISKVCLGKISQTGGYKFKYA